MAVKKPAQHEALIEPMIVELRGQKVILDRDLAVLHDVTTSRLNEQVSRNAKRFPDDFMFRLRAPERSSLRSQDAISSEGEADARTSHGHSPNTAWPCSPACSRATRQCR